MYKDEGRSKQAKTLRTLLNGKGLSLTHAQCLELLAQLEGFRTLHVANATNRFIHVHETACEQARAVMFDSLGKYADRFDQLLSDLNRLEDIEDAREQDQLYRSIFRKEEAVVVSSCYVDVQAAELPNVFDALVQKLRSCLLRKAQLGTATQETLFQGTVVDWEKFEGVLDEGVERPDYRLRIVRSGAQFLLELIPADADRGGLSNRPQLSIGLEVNDGKPCVHLSNDVHGDQVLTVFSLASGLYLRPADQELRIATGIPSAGSDLAAHYESETQPPFGPRYAFNHAFIESDNRDD